MDQFQFRLGNLRANVGVGSVKPSLTKPWIVEYQILARHHTNTPCWAGNFTKPGVGTDKDFNIDMKAELFPPLTSRNISCKKYSGLGNHSPCKITVTRQPAIWTFKTLLPVAVVYADLVSHWTRSGHNYAIMKKIFRSHAHLVSLLEKYLNRECIFLPDAGASCNKYLKTSAMIRSGLELESHLQGKPLLALETLETSNGAVLNQQKRLSPPGAFGHPGTRLFSFLLIGSTQSYVEDDLEDWLSTPPSAELRHQLHEYDGKIVAMVILEAWEFILRKRVNGKEMFSLCNSVAAALADCHHDRVNRGDEQDMWFAGRLTAGGNIESLTREAPQPDPLLDPLHFRRAYGMVMRELLTAQDAEEERDAQDLYWKSDIKVPLTLVETSQNTAPVPPAAWPSRVRKASCILQEKSISRDRERELRVKVDPSNAFSLSSKVKTDSLNSRAGCLTGGTSSSNWPGRPCRPRMIMSAVQTWSTWAIRAGVLKSYPSAVTDAEKSRFADFEVPVRKLGHVGPSFHEYSQGLEHSRYLCWIKGTVWPSKIHQPYVDLCSDKRAAPVPTWSTLNRSVPRRRCPCLRGASTIHVRGHSQTSVELVIEGLDEPLPPTRLSCLLWCVLLQSKVYRVMDTAAYRKSCMEGEMHHPKLSLHVSLLDARYPILISEGVRMLMDRTTPADNFMVSMTWLSQIGVSLLGESIFLQLLRFKLSTQQVRPSVWTRHA